MTSQTRAQDVERAIIRGDEEFVADFLASESLSLDLKVAVLGSFFMPALVLACQHKRERIAQLLMFFYLKNQIPLLPDDLCDFLKIVIHNELNGALELYLEMNNLGGIEKREIRRMQDADGHTLLAFACDREKIKCAEHLIGHGLDEISLTTSRGDNLLHLLARRQLWGVLFHLLKHLPMTELPTLLDSANRDGFTPLFVAATQEDNREMVCALVELGSKLITKIEGYPVRVHSFEDPELEAFFNFLEENGVETSPFDAQGQQEYYRKHLKLDEVFAARFFEIKQQLASGR